MSEKFPKHECGLYLTHNENRNEHISIQEWIILNGEQYAWESKAAQQISISSDELWTLRWYPNTAVGFHAIAASTFEDLLRIAEKVQNQ